MLEISKLNAWYGASHVLQDVGIEIARGEIVCLIGRNGAGKTTTLKSIMGLMDRTRGSVIFKGKELVGEPAHTRFALGLAYVPEERRIVQGLSVRENLRLGLVASPEKKREVELIQGIANQGYADRQVFAGFSAVNQSSQTRREEGIVGPTSG